MKLALELVLVPSLVLAAWGTHRANVWLQERAVERGTDGDIGPLPDGRVVHVLALGFERLVADLAWVRTVYYVGAESSSVAGWPAAERLAHFVTDVDPQFDTVYVLMSSVLNGLRSDPDAAIRLLEKAEPISKYWRIHFLLGFQYFMEKGDYQRGARCLERAVELGGPTYLQFLVSRLYAHGGDPSTAMQFLSARLQHEENAEVRAKLEKRLSDVWINRDLRLIDEANARFREARRRDAASVRELVEAGFLKAEPRDPKGGAYALAQGRAATALEYEVLELNQVR